MTLAPTLAATRAASLAPLWAAKWAPTRAPTLTPTQGGEFEPPRTPRHPLRAYRPDVDSGPLDRAKSVTGPSQFSRNRTVS